MLSATLVPLDVTYQCVLTPADVRRLQQIDSPVTRFVADATRFLGGLRGRSVWVEDIRHDSPTLGEAMVMNWRVAALTPKQRAMLEFAGSASGGRRSSSDRPPDQERQHGESEYRHQHRGLAVRALGLVRGGAKRVHSKGRHPLANFLEMMLDLLDLPANFVVVMGWGMVFLLPAHALACRLAGLYRGIWMFASLPDLKRVLRAVGFSTIALLAFFAFYRHGQQVVPRSLLVFPCFFCPRRG